MVAEKRSIWYYVKNYKFQSIFVKNFLLIGLFIILPLTTVNFAIYGYYGSILKSEIGDAYESSLRKVRDMVDMVAGEAEKLALRVAYDRDIENLLANPMKIYQGYGTVEVLQNILKSMSISTSQYIDSVYVYSELNNYILTSSGGVWESENFVDNDWLGEYEINKNNRNMWISARQIPKTLERDRPHSGISYYYTVPLMGGQKNGVVIANINAEKFNDFLERTGDKRIEELYIIDTEDRILFNQKPERAGKRFGDISELQGIRTDTFDSYQIKDIDGVECVISCNRSGYNNWRYLSIIPLPEYQKQVNNLKKFIAMSIVISILTAVFLGFLLSLRVFRPIKNIMEMMEKPEIWAGESRRNGEKNLNEYKFITSNIMKARDENRHMLDELNRRISMLKQAQMVALQSQINPHFLNNTLQAVNWTVIRLTGEENEASSILESLARILRSTMETEGFLTPIGEEIAHAKEFIEIEKVRYKNRFEVHWQIAQEVEEYMIARIVLQPLLENAIYHGIKPKREKGCITVKGELDKGMILLTIADDGVGMDEEEIKRINMEFQMEYISSVKHIGLRNVNQRLKLIFGKEYGIEICPGEEVGTMVKVLIPKVEKDAADGILYVPEKGIHSYIS